MHRERFMKGVGEKRRSGWAHAGTHLQHTRVDVRDGLVTELASSKQGSPRETLCGGTLG